MKQKNLHLFLIILIVINFGTVGCFGYQNYLLEKDNSNLKNELLEAKINLALKEKDLGKAISLLELELAETETARDNFELKFRLERERMNFLSSQLENIEGTVGILEKLSQTDPELLKKYSKVYFLNENYLPETFTKITPKYTHDTNEDYLIYSKIWPFLEQMMKAAKDDNIDIKIISAYRSFGEQSILKSSYTFIYGSGANQFSADQGYSEHQLGTTLDFTTSEIGNNYLGFEETPAYQWLLNNAYKYGFILSYPEGNEYYQFEPWHWRFVGRDLADKLHREGKNFYDLSQREIDEYLISFFD